MIKRLLPTSLALLLVFDVLTLLQFSSFGLKSLLAFYLVTVAPGMALLSLLRLKHLSTAEVFAHSIGLSLAFAFLSGLALNFGLPLLGIERPLSFIPLLAWLNLSLVALTGLAWRHRSTEPAPTRLAVSFSKLDIVAITIPVASFMLAVLGATTLNNQGSNALVMATLLLLAAYVIFVAIFRRNIRESIYPFALFTISTALLCLYALRSWHVHGYDINQELQVFTQTLSAGQWAINHGANAAYNACLSITILPTMLHELMGAPAEYIYKFWMQLLFSITPVTIFLLYRTYVTSIIAFLACAFFLMQTWFIQDMPALIRQEVAFIFFALLLLTLLRNSYARWHKIILFSAYTFGIVLAHYSTSYVWILFMVIGLIVSLILKLASRLPNVQLLRPWMLAITIAMVIVWEGLFTGTSGKITELYKSVSTHATEAFSSANATKVLDQLTFRGNTQNTQAAVEAEYRDVLQLYTEERGDYLYPNYAKEYVPVHVTDDKALESRAPAWLKEGSEPAAQLLKFLLVIVAPTIGLVIAVVKRRKFPIGRDYLALSLATFPIVALLILIPAIKSSYNLTRLFMQAIMLLSLPAIMGMMIPLKKLVKKAAPVFAATFIAVFFLNSSGFTAQLVGKPSTIVLNHPGAHYDALYIHDAEASSAKWLADNATQADIVYADELAVVRLRSFGDRSNALPAIHPSTIDRRAYVYLGYTNVTRQVGYVYAHGEIESIAYPIGFLDDEKDLIYSSQTSRIYK